jgi:hypothetical protein
LNSSLSFFLHLLVEQGFASHLSRGQLQLIVADFLDGVDTDISKLWDVLLQISWQ